MHPMQRQRARHASNYHFLELGDDWKHLEKHSLSTQSCGWRSSTDCGTQIFSRSVLGSTPSAMILDEKGGDALAHASDLAKASRVRARQTSRLLMVEAKLLLALVHLVAQKMCLCSGKFVYARAAEGDTSDAVDLCHFRLAEIVMEFTDQPNERM
jgi:hypothetical protein